MPDRRFPEQHEDLQQRARWDEESPETSTDRVDSDTDGTDSDPSNGTSHFDEDGSAHADHLDADDSDRALTDRTGTDDAVGRGTVDEAAADRGITDVASEDDDSVPLTDVAGTDAQADSPDASGVEAAAHPAIPETAPSADAVGGTADPTTADPATDELFPDGAGDKLRDRWQHIQVDFVDDPRHAVEEADSLVDQVAAQLAESIAAHRRTLREGWDGQGAGVAEDGGSPTEQLRVALQDYRRILNRLLDA